MICIPTPFHARSRISSGMGDPVTNSRALGWQGAGSGEPFVHIFFSFFSFFSFFDFFLDDALDLEKSKRGKEVITSSGKRNPGEILPCGRLRFKPRSPLNDVRLDRVDPDPRRSTRIRIPCHLASPVLKWIKFTCSVGSWASNRSPRLPGRG